MVVWPTQGFECDGTAAPAGEAAEDVGPNPRKENPAGKNP